MATEADSPMGDLRIDSRLTIPEGELQVSFQTSGGPGGQHANRSATGVTLVWDYENSSALDERRRNLLRARLGGRGAGGSIRVIADKSRSQWRNRSLARSRLAELVAAALAPPKPRRLTKPSRGAKQRRVEQKRRRSITKALCRRPESE